MHSSRNGFRQLSLTTLPNISTNRSERHAVMQKQAGLEGQGEVSRMGENYGEAVGGRRSREEEHESRSGSDNMDGGSGDDLDLSDNPRKKKRYHRHTPQQIQELEAMCMHTFGAC